MQEGVSDRLINDFQSGHRLSRAYKDIVQNAKLNLDYMEECVRNLPGAGTTLPTSRDSQNKHKIYLSRSGMKTTAALSACHTRQCTSVDQGSDITDDEAECMPISCLLVTIRHIILAFASTEHLERFIRNLKQINEVTELQSVIRIYIALDGSASSYHVCDLTSQQLLVLLLRGLYHETDILDTGIGSIHLVRLPLMACVKLPFIESAGMQVNVMGRILSAKNTKNLSSSVSRTPSVVPELIPFAAKCELPNLLKPVYENIIMYNGKAITHMSYLGVPNTSELLYDSEKMAQYGLPLVGTLHRDSIRHYQLLTEKDFEQVSFYPAAVSLIAYVFCSSSKADELLRRYKQKAEIVTRLSRSSAILNSTLKEQLVTANASTYTHEDVELLKLQYKDFLSLEEGGFVRAVDDDGREDYYYKQELSDNHIVRSTHDLNNKHRFSEPSTIPSRPSKLHPQPGIGSPQQHVKMQRKLQSSPSEERISIFITNLECRYLPEEVSTVTLEVIFGLYPVQQSLPPVPATNGHAMWVGEMVTLTFNPYKIVPYIEYKLQGYNIKHSVCYTDVAILSLVDLFPQQYLEKWTACRTIGQVYCRLSTPLISPKIISNMSVFTATGQISNFQYDGLNSSNRELNGTDQFISSRGVLSTHNLASSIGVMPTNYNLNNANDDSILSVISDTAEIEKRIKNLSHFGPSSEADVLTLLQLSAGVPTANRSPSFLRNRLKKAEKERFEDDFLNEYNSLNDSHTAAVLSKYSHDPVYAKSKKKAEHPTLNHESPHEGKVKSKHSYSGESSSSYENDSSSSLDFSIDLRSGLEKPSSLSIKSKHTSQHRSTLQTKITRDSSSSDSDSIDEIKGEGNGNGKIMVPDTQWLLDRARNLFKREDSSEESDSNSSDY